VGVIEHGQTWARGGQNGPQPSAQPATTHLSVDVARLEAHVPIMKRGSNMGEGSKARAPLDFQTEVQDNSPQPIAQQPATHLSVEVACLEAHVGAVRQSAGHLEEASQAAHTLPVEFNHLGERPQCDLEKEMKRFLPIRDWPPPPPQSIGSSALIQRYIHRSVPPPGI
jgi:hypothetical protein